jgi:hypothetical protein
MRTIGRPIDRGRRRWRGPGQGLGESYEDSGQTVPELLNGNRFGADGWELAGIQDFRDGGDGSSYWEASQLLTVYAFKRPYSEDSGPQKIGRPHP